jgi:hypothetical protein
MWQTLRGERAQAMLEYMIAVLLAVVIILGIIQLGLLYNASSMVKLAAFNAARAAIVARGEKPEDPVTLKQMQEKACWAAAVTLIPVMPEIQGRVPTSLFSAPSQVADLIGNLSAAQGLGVGAELLGCAAPGLPDALKMIKVQFVQPKSDPQADGATITSIDDKIEFDDPGKSPQDDVSDNVIKVYVEWKYPLVIPFINKILFSLLNPKLYAGLYLATESGADPLLAAKIAAFGAQEALVWTIGLPFERLRQKSGLSDFAWSLLIYRVPVRATYVMRMQWDRGPAS